LVNPSTGGRVSTRRAGKRARPQKEAAGGATDHLLAQRLNGERGGLPGKRRRGKKKGKVSAVGKKEKVGRGNKACHA